VTTRARSPEPGWAEDELRSLSLEYAAAVDNRDGERLARLFVPDGELVVPNFPDELGPVVTRSGHRALRRVPEGLRRYDRTFHQLSNQQYAIDGGQATGQVQCVAHHISAAPAPAAPDDGAPDDGDAAAESGASGHGGNGTGGTDVVWFLRYHDDYRLTDEGWRIVRRELHLQWVEEHPVTVLGP
jgi:ketosteroid isomerase-like protein